MILVCPSCGAVASLEAWLSDPDWRELIEFFPAIPAALQRRAVSYLGLWRKGGRALRPAKALKVLRGLHEMVGNGTVHWEQGETRPAPVELWAEALDAVIERRPAALTNHNYLKHTAWDMAAGLAAEKERASHRRGAESTEGGGSAGFHAGDLSAFHGGDHSVPKRRGCFTCEHFRPPKSCSEGSHPPSGNQILGCPQWREKPAPVGDLMGGLAGALVYHEGRAQRGEGHEKGEP